MSDKSAGVPEASFRSRQRPQSRHSSWAVVLSSRSHGPVVWHVLNRLFTKIDLVALMNINYLQFTNKAMQDREVETIMSNAVKTILQVDASARQTGSVTRELTDTLVKTLVGKNPGSKVLTRDVSQGLPFLDEEWVGANFTDPAERSAEQRMKLALSDTLVSELKSADTIVIGTPIYNFSVPAALKAWIDQIARARETFKYTDNGPVGLLEGKKAYVLVASGGTKVGSEIDFAATYLKHVLGFVGIKDITIVAADQLMVDPAKKEEALARTLEVAA